MVSIDWLNTLQENYNYYYVYAVKGWLVSVGKVGGGEVEWVTGGPNLPTSYALRP